MLKSELVFLGMSLMNDTKIRSLEAAAEAGKKETSIQPGDIVGIDETGKLKKVTVKTQTIYGVATIGGHGYTVPVVTYGHVCALAVPAVFTGVKVGDKLPDKFGPIIVRDMKAKKNTEDAPEVNAWELYIN